MPAGETGVEHLVIHVTQAKQGQISYVLAILTQLKVILDNYIFS